MKNLSVAAIVLALMSAAPAYNASAAPAASEQNAASKAEQEKIQAILAEVDAAAESGDEALASKLLASAIKANPDLATKIVAAFVDSQKTSKTASSKKSVDVDAVVQNVVTSLQNEKGSEGLIAAVLSTYTPAAGNNQNKQNNQNNQNNNKPDVKENKGFGGDNNKDKEKELPKENKGQNSPN